MVKALMQVSQRGNGLVGERTSGDDEEVKVAVLRVKVAEREWWRPPPVSP